MNKLPLRVLKTLDTISEEELGRYVESHSIEQIHQVEGLTGSWEQADHDLSPSLEDLQVTHPVLDKHGSDQLSAV